MSGHRDTEWAVAICGIVIINDAIDMLHKKGRHFGQVKTYGSAFRGSIDHFLAKHSESIPSIPCDALLNWGNILISKCYSDIQMKYYNTTNRTFFLLFCKIFCYPILNLFFSIKRLLPVKLGVSGQQRA